MKLYHYEHRNFGDAMNRWLWHRLMPGVLDEDGSAIFIGIGTILNNVVPDATHKVVFGSGVGYRRALVVDPSWTFYCVRGPLSARALGLPPESAVTDAAALIRLIRLPAEPQVHDASYIPHWLSDEYWNWRDVCQEAGVHYIDPLDDFEHVVREIRRSKVVYAEAMHGAILADALRVPWVAIRAYKHILRFKWVDWCSSLELAYEPAQLLPLYSREQVVDKLLAKSRGHRRPHWQRLGLRGAAWTADHVYDPVPRRLARQNVRALRRIVRTAAPRLSREQVIRDATDRLEERLGQFKRDHLAGRFA
jgi:succinoglycan biosynthesis protein ExoV